MLLAITMPTWLSDFWFVYGDMITPVLVTLMISILTYLALKIRSDAKVNAAKADLQIEALKQVANREDNKPQLKAQSDEIAKLSDAVSNLSDMVNLAFQNSSLDPEIKNNLTAIVNKIKYGTEIDLSKLHEEEVAVLKEQIATLTTQIKNQNAVEVTTTTPRTRTRR